MFSGRATDHALTERRLGKRRIEIAGNILKAKRNLPATCADRVGAAIICVPAGRRWSELEKHWWTTPETLQSGQSLSFLTKWRLVFIDAMERLRADGK